MCIKGRAAPWAYGLIKAKRPARAKALIINAFALTGRIVICDTFTQGDALGYVLLPLRGVLFMSFDTLTSKQELLQYCSVGVFLLGWCT